MNVHYVKLNVCFLFGLNITLSNSKSIPVWIKPTSGNKTVISLLRVIVFSHKGLTHSQTQTQTCLSPHREH